MFSINALNQKTSTRPERVAGLRRDMFYLRRFPHPNVVQVFGAFEEKGVLYMVMEYVAHSLRSKSVVRKVDLVRVLADVARALVSGSRRAYGVDRDPRNFLSSPEIRLSWLPS